MHNPHYDEQGSVAPPAAPISDFTTRAGGGVNHTYCRKCLKDIAIDTDGGGRVIAKNLDGSLHPCEGA